MSRLMPFAGAMLTVLFIQLTLTPAYPPGVTPFQYPPGQFPWMPFVTKVLCGVAYCALAVLAVISRFREYKLRRVLKCQAVIIEKLLREGHEGRQLAGTEVEVLKLQKELLDGLRRRI